jgi:hypothetical protein
MGFYHRSSQKWSSGKFAAASQKVSKKGEKRRTPLKIHGEFIGLCFSDGSQAQSVR